jgi:hypothetical protein
MWQIGHSAKIAMSCPPILFYPNIIINLKIHSEHFAAYFVRKDGSRAGLKTNKESNNRCKINIELTTKKILAAILFDPITL